MNDEKIPDEAKICKYGHPLCVSRGSVSARASNFQGSKSTNFCPFLPSFFSEVSKIIQNNAKISHVRKRYYSGVKMRNFEGIGGHFLGVFKSGQNQGKKFPLFKPNLRKICGQKSSKRLSHRRELNN